MSTKQRCQRTVYGPCAARTAVHRSNAWTMIALLSAVIALATSVPINSQVHAQDDQTPLRTEKDIAQDLLQLLSGEPDEWKLADEMFTAILPKSPLKNPAATAMALIRIREERFKEAWQVLSDHPPLDNTTSPGLLASQQRIRLWLAIESGNRQLAGEHFQRMVQIAIQAARQNQDVLLISDNYQFLGRLMGMCHLADTASMVPRETIETAYKQLAEVGSAKAKAAMSNGVTESQQWGKSLGEQIRAFQELGLDAAKRKLAELVREKEAALIETQALRARMKQWLEEERTTRAQLSRNRSRAQSALRRTEAELKIPTPGQPRRPVEPKEPDRLDFYKRRERGGSDFDDFGYDRAISKFRSDYDKYARDMNKYNIDHQRWLLEDAARRSKLTEALATAQDEFNQFDQALRELAQKSKEMRASGEYAVANKRLMALDKQLRIGAISVESLSQPGASTPYKPSNFEIFDFDAERAALNQGM